MKRSFVLLFVSLVFVGCAYRNPNNAVRVQQTSDVIPSSVTTRPMNIESSAFQHNQSLPSKYTCDGDNVNPPLRFLDVPAEAKSLALIVDDPDAPRGTWVHWLLWNIAPGTTEIFENTVPSPGIATQGNTSFGSNTYGGPCPPSGTHRYFFKLYALDAVLDLPSSAGKTQLEAAMEGHVLASAELIGLYQRKK